MYNPFEPILNELSEIRKEIRELKNQKPPSIQAHEPDFISRKELAEKLSVNLSTIHHWTKKGKLRAYGIGGRVYYKWTEVEHALKPLT